MKKRLLSLALIIGTSLSLVACGSAAATSAPESAKLATQDYDGAAYDDYDNYAYDAEAPEEFGDEYATNTEGTTADSVDESAAASNKSDRKLIRNVSLSLETTDLDDLMGSIQSKMKAVDGYIETSDIQNASYYDNVRKRSASLTIRIPADKLDSFLEVVEGKANVISKNENVQDVTLDYVDMEAHKKTLQAESDRVLELMQQTTDIDEMIVLENRLSELRYQIESMESQLRTYDNRVNYSTVYVNISEVVELTEVEEPAPDTFWNRISTGFSESLKGVGDGLTNFVVWLITALPYLVIWALIIFIIVMIVRAIIRKIKKTSEKNRAKKAEKYAAMGVNPSAPVVPGQAPPAPGAAPAPAPAPSTPVKSPEVPVYDPGKGKKEDKKADKKDKA